MNFHTVATYLLAIEDETSRTIITQHLATLFRDATADEAAFLAYFSLGQLYAPHHNKQLNLAEKSVVRALATLLQREQGEVAREVKAIGDVGLFVEQALQSDHFRVLHESFPELHESFPGEDPGPSDRGPRIKSGEGASSLTLLDVKDQLHTILELSGTGSQEAKETQLVTLLQRCTPLAARYIVRSVVGKLRLGFSDMTLLDAYSWMARGDKTLRPQLEHCYNVSADMGHVIKLFKEQGSDGLHHATIIPGVPVRPAAAERLADSQAIIEKLGHSVAQPKLDGFRVQVHVWTNEQGKRQVRFFSRNLRDMSDMFPDLAVLVRDLPCSSVVMEGEAIVHDPVTGQFLPFQETVKRKRKHNVQETAAALPLTLYLFDLLFEDGHSQLAVGHDVRRRRMQELCANLPTDGQVVVIEEREVHTGAQLAAYFDEAMSHGLEGLVVKKITAHYQPGKRNFNWIKLKRQETGSLSDTVDCVILGYYAGRGKRAAFGIGALLVGIFDPKKDRFQTVAKIGTGLSDEEWRTHKKACDAEAAPEQPHNVACVKELAPDVWTVPTRVCMIRADDISRSPVHTAGKKGDEPGFALRFPRIMGMRPDKNATQSTTPIELARLYELQNLKVT
ncbi:MAG: ATP-dependent DNA ligase [Candidatus Dependentiae bacterium]